MGDEIKHLAICRAHEIEHLAISLLFPPPLSPKEPPYLTSCLTPTPSFWLQNKLNGFISHVHGPLQINNNKTNKVLDSKYLAVSLVDTILCSSPLPIHRRCPRFAQGKTNILCLARRVRRDADN
jgi:hypothetical protein